LEEVDRRLGELADELRLLARLDVDRAHVIERGLPIGVETELGRDLLHLSLAPCELAPADLEKLFGGIGNSLGLERANEGLPTDRIPDERRIPALLIAIARELLSQIPRVALERPLRLLVGLLRPPGEDRIVSRVESVPLAER